MSTRPSSTAPHHPGFKSGLGATSARHQLNMSAGVVVVLAIAIAASLFAFRPDRTVEMGSRATLTMFASAHNAAVSSSAQGG